MFPQPDKVVAATSAPNTESQGKHLGNNLVVFLQALGETKEGLVVLLLLLMLLLLLLLLHGGRHS